MNTVVRDPLAKIINEIFKNCGYHETIEKQTVHKKTQYRYVPTHFTHKTMKERLGTRWWIPIADFISLFNALGSAFFAGFAFFLAGQVTIGTIIFTAAFFANFLLFLTAQRETFIQLFVQSDLLHHLSFMKKISILLASVLCLASALFEGYIIGVSATTALVHISFLSSFAVIGLSFLVGSIMALGIFALFFYMSITLIKNDFHLKIARFIHKHLLFKGFLDKSFVEKSIYLVTWLLNVVLLPLALVSGFIYTAAYLGIGYDQMLKALEKIPQLTYTLSVTIVSFFIGISFIMQLAFAEKNFVRLAKVVAQLPKKVINHIENAIKKDSTKDLTFENEKSLIREKGETFKDMVWNNPERFFLPCTRFFLYVGIIGFLIPINAFGNAKSSAEGTPTLLELLHKVGLDQFSEWMINKIVFLTGLIGSFGVCALFSHDELSNYTPSTKAHPQLPNLVQDYQDPRDTPKKPFQYSENCKIEAITCLFAMQPMKKINLSSHSSVNSEDWTITKNPSE